MAALSALVFAVFCAVVSVRVESLIAAFSSSGSSTAFSASQPVPQPRLDHHRPDDLHDRVRIQATLEQRAEDAGLDGAPVQFARAVQQLELVLGERQDVVVVEQPAVEPGDVLEGNVAANAHGREQVAAPSFEGLRPTQRRLHQLGENVVRQDLDVLGEHAEQQPIEEMRDGLGAVVAGAQGAGQVGELVCVTAARVSPGRSDSGAWNTLRESAACRSRAARRP